MKKALLSICLLGTLLACDSKNSLVVESRASQSTDQANEKPVVRKATAEEFGQLLSEDSDPQLVDVRTGNEYAAGHLQGSTNMNIADATFVERVSGLDKEKPVYVYCAVGGRSAQAAKTLADLGFTEVVDLKGGITAWNGEGKKVVK